MPTASTKSDNRSRGNQPPASLSGSTADISDRSWQIAALLIFAVAAFLRFYNLNLVPLHHDEGVNGNFLVRLVREGVYHYDPANYHGPTLYYFGAVFPWLLRLLFGTNAQNTYGLTNIAIRMVPALFGLATVGLIFTLRRNLGTIATLVAALLLAISPGAVYLSRYFIHETLFVFFTLALVVSLIKFYESAQAHHLMLAAISAALLFATKETAMISAGVLLISLAMTLAYRRWFVRPTTAKPAKKKRQSIEEQPTFVRRIGGGNILAIWIAAAVVVFVAVYVVFYSSFFTNYPKGVYDSLRTFEFWRKTGQQAHVHPFLTYVWWLFLQESPLLFLGAAGALLTLRRNAKPLALFSALWAFGLIAAYSLIAYKTPWLALSFLVPLALLSGSFIQWLHDELVGFGHSRSVVLAVGLLVLVGILPGIARAWDHREVHWKTFVPLYQTIDLNFINYDNDDRYYVYVYAHTRRETLKLVDEINRIAQRSHQGGATGITIVSPDYWPLPWYLRDYNRVGYYGHITPSNEPMILASTAQAAEIQATYGDRYQQVQSGFNPEGSFALRPGVDLLLYARRELLP
ncbi:MAG TPA: flippase activity-associated protein Agl23 [Pyrinomonadaceae bacterium]|nr:flippase activity-associated protein Agl23 [Pyrinomonadaceae bacterium]